MKISRRKLLSSLAIGSLLGIAGSYFFINYQNNHLGLTEIEYSSSRIPPSFDQFKILHISDLHNKEFGFKQKELLDLTYRLRPDIIVITGDLIDGLGKTKLQPALDYIEGALLMAPIYYVSGNHEYWSKRYSEFKEKLKTLVVDNRKKLFLLEDKQETITRTGGQIQLCGLSDPLMTKDPDKMLYTLNFFKEEKERRKLPFSLLLSHRPELLGLYSKFPIDLILSGHAHGGQFRIPLLCPSGLFAPNQGWLPKYTAGIYHQNSSSMIVSRGLGNSLIPLRLFNPPEVILIKLCSRQQ